MNMLVNAVVIVDGPPASGGHGLSPVNSHGMAAYC